MADNMKRTKIDMGIKIPESLEQLLINTEITDSDIQREKAGAKQYIPIDDDE